MLLFALLLAQVDRDVELLGDEDLDVREAAMERLREAGDGALPALRGALQSPDAEVRVRAEHLLHRAGALDLSGGERWDRVYRLKHADAAEVAWVLAELFRPEPRSAVPASVYRAHGLANAILVRAPAEECAIADAVVRELDQPSKK